MSSRIMFQDVVVKTPVRFPEENTITASEIAIYALIFISGTNVFISMQATFRPQTG